MFGLLVNYTYSSNSNSNSNSNLETRLVAAALRLRRREPSCANAVEACAGEMAVAPCVDIAGEVCEWRDGCSSLAVGGAKKHG